MAMAQRQQVATLSPEESSYRDITQELLEHAPVLFAEDVLGDALWSKQRDILESVAAHEKTAVASCHSSGKTFLTAQLVIWFLYTRAPAIVFTTAPTWSQVRLLLWREINAAFGRLPADLRQYGDCQQTSLNIWPTLKREGQTEHFAVGRSTDDANNLQGLHAPHLLVIVDEAAGVPESVFEIVDTFGAGGEYREVLIGNPTSMSGRFYDAFARPELGYNCIRIAAEDTPNWTGEDVPEVVKRQLFQPSKAAEWKLKHGEESAYYQARVKAQFPSGSEDSIVIPLSWVEAAQNRLPLTGGDQTRQMGVDVARFGDNRSSIAQRVGATLMKLESKSGNLDTLQVVAWVKEEAVQFAQGGAVTVLVDEGYNPGVIDLLKATPLRGVTFEAVAFGGGAVDADPEAPHINRRCEMYWHLRGLSKTGNNLPDLAIAAPEGDAHREALERFTSQVASMQYRYDARLRPRIETKDEMKARGLPSPDEGDAVALAFAPSTERIITRPRGSVAPVTMQRRSILG